MTIPSVCYPIRADSDKVRLNYIISYLSAAHIGLVCVNACVHRRFGNMSKINIGRAVQNILPSTTPYTPLVEVIVNAIESIEEVVGDNSGKIEIRVLRSDQTEVEGGLSRVEGFEIRDNGVGFTDVHREAFDTLYTDQKIEKGGRGFGRFVCLKHFKDFDIRSVYRDSDGQFRYRTFLVGRNNEIIENEEVGESQSTDSGTIVRLFGLREGTSFDLELDTIGKRLVQRLLPLFVEEREVCPEIILSEKDDRKTIILNQYLDYIEEIDGGSCSFKLPSSSPEEEFTVRVFKIYKPRDSTNKITLVAHRREVSQTSLKKYVPEFEEAFYEDNDEGRKYIVKAYVFGDYLDKHVSVERGGFRFGPDPELYTRIGKTEIESNAADIARDAIGSDFQDRKAKKRERVQEFVDNNAPWLKSVLDGSDLTKLKWNATPDETEEFLHVEKLQQERDIQNTVDEIVSGGNSETLEEDVVEIIGRVSQKSKDDLVRYIIFRRAILELFGKSLEKDEHEKYLFEGTVHDIIFPRGRDSDSTPLEGHNLWIIDERLNFAKYVSSDKPIGAGSPARPDLLIYDKRVLFRGENIEANPITIFEFKRPGRGDLVKDNSNPIDQIISYVRDIRKRRGKTSSGRPIHVTRNTPAYGFLVCDLTSDFEEWLLEARGFTPMPDGLGFYDWAPGVRLYIEVLSWDKLLKDAKMRNRIFFKKLGIN